MPKGSYKTDAEVKSKVITVRVTVDQQEHIDKLIESGKAKTNASAIQYLINKDITLFGGSK